MGRMRHPLAEPNHRAVMLREPRSVTSSSIGTRRSPNGITNTKTAGSLRRQADGKEDETRLRATQIYRGSALGLWAFTYRGRYRPPHPNDLVCRVHAVGKAWDASAAASIRSVAFMESRRLLAPALRSRCSSRGSSLPASVKTTVSSAMRHFRHRAGLRTSVCRCPRMRRREG